MVNITYNLIDKYEISVVDNKMYWVDAQEWEYQSFECEDVNAPARILTDYVFGECEIIDGILVLQAAQKFVRVDNDASNFYETLKNKPKWLETESFASDLDSELPSIKYCKNGNHVPLDYAMYFMTIFGYQWNPDSGRFEKKEIEELAA